MTNFVQTRGFDLLANQLKRHSVSAELLSALFSIALGGTVALPATRLEGGGDGRVRGCLRHTCLHQRVHLFPLASPLLHAPPDLTSYQMASLVPVLTCLTRTTHQPALCRSALGILHQVGSGR